MNYKKGLKKMMSRLPDVTSYHKMSILLWNIGKLAGLAVRLLAGEQ